MKSRETILQEIDYLETELRKTRYELNQVELKEKIEVGKIVEVKKDSTTLNGSVTGHISICSTIFILNGDENSFWLTLKGVKGKQIRTCQIGIGEFRKNFCIIG